MVSPWQEWQRHDKFMNWVKTKIWEASSKQWSSPQDPCLHLTVSEITGITPTFQILIFGRGVTALCGTLCGRTEHYQASAVGSMSRWFDWFAKKDGEKRKKHGQGWQGEDDTRKIWMEAGQILSKTYQHLCSVFARSSHSSCPPRTSTRTGVTKLSQVRSNGSCFCLEEE